MRIIVILISFISFQAIANDSSLYLIDKNKNMLAQFQFLINSSDDNTNPLLEKITLLTKQTEITTKKPSPYFEIYKSQYFIGKNKQLILKMESISLYEEDAQRLMEEYCQEIKCDLIYKGPKIIDYFPSHLWSDVLRANNSTETINFYYGKTQFSFSSKLKKNIKDELIKSTIPELIYFGEQGEILYLSPNFISPHKIIEQSSGTYLVRDGMKKQVLKRLISKEEVRELVEASNADCGFSGNREALYICTTNLDNEMNYPSSWPQELGLKYWNGYTHFHFIESERNNIYPLLVKLVTPYMAYEPEKIQYHFSESAVAQIYHKKKFDVASENKSPMEKVKIKYYRDNKFIGECKFYGVGHDLRKQTHEVILENQNITQFETFLVKNNDEEIPLGRYTSTEATPLEVTMKRSAKEANLFFALDITQRAFKVNNPSTYTFLNRNEREDVSPTFSIEWWPKNKPWGLYASYQKYDFLFSDAGGDKKGSNEEILISSEYRLIKQALHFKYDIRFGFGLEKRDYLVEDSTVMSTFKIFDVPIKFESNIFWKKYIFNGKFKLAPVLHLSQENSSSNPWDKMLGYSTAFELKVKKELNPSLYFTLGGHLRLTTINLDREKFSINERGFSIGLEIPLNF